MKERLAKLTITAGLSLSILMVLVCVGIGTWAHRDNRVVMLGMFTTAQIPADLMTQINTDADRLLTWMETSYPPTVSGWRRILPWNWSPEPEPPASLKALYSLVKIRRTGNTACGFMSADLAFQAPADPNGRGVADHFKQLLTRARSTRSRKIDGCFDIGSSIANEVEEVLFGLAFVAMLLHFHWPFAKRRRRLRSGFEWVFGSEMTRFIVILTMGLLSWLPSLTVWIIIPTALTLSVTESLRTLGWPRNPYLAALPDLGVPVDDLPAIRVPKADVSGN